MNRTKVNIIIPSQAENGLVWYTAEAAGNIIFRGKAFVTVGQTVLSLDLTDIVSNYIYRGYGILNPTWSNSDKTYQQPYTGSNATSTINVTYINGVNNELHNENVTVRVYSNSTYTTQIGVATLISVYFHSIGPEDEIGGRYLGLSTVVYYSDPALIPHMPKVATNELAYGQLLQNTNITSTIDLLNSNNVTTTSMTFNASKAAVFNLTLNTLLTGKTYPDNKLYWKRQGSSGMNPCLVFDECPKPYYLLWINPNGGFQSYGFNAVYTENYTNNFRITADDQKYLSNKTLTSKWKIKANTTEDQYKCIQTAARSPYCVLYITEYDRSFMVNVTDTKVDRKTRYSEKHKPFNIELEVEAAESEFVVI